MKKIFILSLILFTGVPISCIWSSFQSVFRIESLEVSEGQLDEQGDPSSFIEVLYNQGNGDTLSVSRLAIEIRISETSVVASASSPWLVPSAYADPAPPRAESKLSLISIYADESVFAGGNEYEAGDNLANLFSLASRYDRESTTILKFIEQMDEWEEGNNLYLTFTTPIDTPISQPFKIDVTLENGTVFNLETEKIVVK